MDIIIGTGFEKITHHISFQPTTEQKGKLLVNAQHVQNVKEHRKIGQSYFIEAQVIRQTSVTSPPYKTTLTINDTRQVSDVSCNCVYNQSGKCKHIAALIYFINHEESLSKTNYEQEWGKPTVSQFTKDQYSKGKYFDKMFPPSVKPPIKPYILDISDLKHPCALKTILIEASRNKDEQSIKDLVSSMLQTVEMNLEVEDCQARLCNFFMMCNAYLTCSNTYQLGHDLKDFYEKNIVMTEEDIVILCCDTLAQSTSKKWFTARRCRISESKNVHSIKTRVKKTVESLVEDMLFPNKIDTAATRYGTQYETHAKAEYSKLFNCEVKKIGVIVCYSNPWLCASLDGVVIEDGCITKIVEIKCPITCKEKPVVDYQQKTCNVNYLHYLDGQVEIKESALYYTQCQKQIYVCGSSVCDLFIYSPVKNGSYVVEIHRNEIFLKSVLLLCESFYFSLYLPALRNAIMKKENQGVQRRCFGSDITNQNM